MKNLFTFLLLCIAGLAHAQSNDNSAFGIGGEVILPASSTYVIGLGFSGKFELPLAAHTSLTVTAGYSVILRQNQFLSNGDSGDAKSLSFTPVKLGIRQHFRQPFYAEAEAGAALRLNSNSGTGVALAGGGGYVLKLSQNSLDLGARAEYWQHRFTMVTLKVAYRFNVK